MRAPDQHSSLGADDRPLQGWNCSTLIRSSLTAGAAQVHAFERIVTQSQVIDGFSSWTLLRAALEDFSTAVWLLTGPSRAERQRRALATWAADLKNRQEYETDTDYVITGPNEKSGDDRREEMMQRAQALGIARETVKSPGAGKVITAAADTIGLDGRRVRAIWRVASGFAHGRYWPNLRASSPSVVYPARDGVLVGLTIDTAKHSELAQFCEQLLDAAVSRYELRAAALR